MCTKVWWLLLCLIWLLPTRADSIPSGVLLDDRPVIKSHLTADVEYG